MRFRRLPFAKQPKKLGGILYQTNNNNRKRTKFNHDLLQEKRTTPQQNNEEEEDRNIRTKDENKLEIYRVIRNRHQTTLQLQTHMKRGNVTCEGHTLERATELLTNKLTNDQTNGCSIYVLVIVTFHI